MHPSVISTTHVARGVVASLGLMCALGAHAQTRYTVTELPVLPGAALCNATGLNEAGDVIGHCGPADENWNQTAVVWREGQPIALGKWSKGTYSQGTVIDNVGGVGGHADTGNLRPQGWVAHADGRWVNFFPNSSGNTYPQFLSDDGWIGGYYIKSSKGPWTGAVWKPSAKDPRKFTTVNLPPLPGAADPVSNQSLPMGFNRLGYAVGYGSHDRSNGQWPLLWHNDSKRTLQVLPTLHAGVPHIAYAINDIGQIVGAGGSPYASEGLQAVLWNNDAARTPEVLPAPDGDNHTRATAINNQGVVLGMSGFFLRAGETGTPRPERPVVWQGDVALDLASLLDGGVYTLRSADAINGLGQIAATGSAGGLVRALLLTPN